MDKELQENGKIGKRVFGKEIKGENRISSLGHPLGEAVFSPFALISLEIRAERGWVEKVEYDVREAILIRSSCFPLLARVPYF